MPAYLPSPPQTRLVASRVVSAYGRNAALRAAAAPVSQTPEELESRKAMEAMQRMLATMHHNNQSDAPEYQELLAVYQDLRDAIAATRD